MECVRLPTMDMDGQELFKWRHVGSDKVFEDVRLTKSWMRSCVLAQFDDPHFTLVVRNLAIENCRATACNIQNVSFSDVDVNGLRLSGLHHLTACVFRHVVFRGSIGPIMAVGPHYALERREEFVGGLIAAYSDIDWALDISDANFSDAGFYYVPGHLVRYDPNTQVLLRREALTDVDRKAMPPFARIWAGRFESTPFDSFVAVAPRRSRNFAVAMQSIAWLHDSGLV